MYQLCTKQTTHIVNHFTFRMIDYTTCNIHFLYLDTQSTTEQHNSSTIETNISLWPIYCTITIYFAIETRVYSFITYCSVTSLIPVYNETHALMSTLQIFLFTKHQHFIFLFCHTHNTIRTRSQLIPSAPH